VGSVAAARPIEAIEAERAAAAAELRDLDRRAASLEDQLELRRRMLRRRLRVLYKLAQGGSFRLIADAGDSDELERRLGAADRLIARDLHELGALDEELDELRRDRARRGESDARAAALDQAREDAADDPRIGLELRRGQLGRPVPGPIVVGLSRVRVGGGKDGSMPLELPRRTVELAAVPQAPVRAIARGVVRWTGEVEGIGRAVIVDHGDRYLSVTGRLEHIAVREGDELQSGTVLGTAAGALISFELSEGRTALDPSGWLTPPIAPAPKAATVRR
jgi:septal ring factor EnvC (AmiA/AmiB activator)